MTSAFPEGGAWPTRAQALLLDAALRCGDAALAAWQAWRASVDFEAGLDRGSYRLLPLVYRNLSQQGVNDQLLGRIKGVYRLTWYKNQLLTRTLAEVVRRLETAKVPTLVLKGASLTQLYYQDLGLRPMDDIDVLVPERQVEAALNTLTQMGWSPKLLRLDQLNAAHRAVRPSCGFQNTSGRDLDLHWHVLMECTEPGADQDFWAGAVPLQVEGVSTRTLNTTDHLLQACVHGLAPNVVPPVRWIADAALILRKAGPELDWNRLCTLAEQRKLGLLLYGALHYLRQAHDAPVPPAVLARLRALPTTPQLRAEYRARTEPVGVLGALPVGWSLYLRQKPPRGPPRGPLGGLARLASFPRYMQVTQGFDHVWQVFTWALARAATVGVGVLTGKRGADFKVAVSTSAHSLVE